jgi:hypothetical protein
MSSAPPPRPLPVLQSRLGTLESLANGFDKLRAAPASFFQPAQPEHFHDIDIGPLYNPAARLNSSFAETTSFSTVLSTGDVQDALNLARESAISDPAAIDPSVSRRDLANMRFDLLTVQCLPIV